MRENQAFNLSPMNEYSEGGMGSARNPESDRKIYGEGGKLSLKTFVNNSNQASNNISQVMMRPAHKSN